jgi:hypothetical protein
MATQTLLRKTLLQKITLACILGSTVASLAADLPKTILADNVVRCQPTTGCTNKVLYGRTYKVLTTPRFVVMVSVSHEGEYTRADVSIANNTGLPLNLTPDDFRVEVISPKPKVLLYIPPSNLKDIPPSPPVPTIQPAPVPDASATEVKPSTQPLNIDELYAAAKKRQADQEAIDQAAALQHLAAATIPPDQVVRGRVYFESDKHAQLVNLVLPIAGVVFEFPYSLKP